MKALGSSRTSVKSMCICFSPVYLKLDRKRLFTLAQPDLTGEREEGEKPDMILKWRTTWPDLGGNMQYFRVFTFQCKFTSRNLLIKHIIYFKR